LNCAFPFSQHCYALLRTQVSLLLLPSKRRPNDSFTNFPFLFFYSSRPAAQLEKYIKIKKRSLKYQHIGIDNRRLFFLRGDSEIDTFICDAYALWKTKNSPARFFPVGWTT
jgi:hypothetical protein